jgi:hypothetical protein
MGTTEGRSSRITTACVFIVPGIRDCGLFKGRGLVYWRTGGEVLVPVPAGRRSIHEDYFGGEFVSFESISGMN